MTNKNDGEVVVDLSKGMERAVYAAAQNFLNLINKGIRNSGDDPQLAAEAMLAVSARALREHGLSSMDVQMMLEIELANHDKGLPTKADVRH